MVSTYSPQGQSLRQSAALLGISKLRQQGIPDSVIFAMSPEDIIAAGAGQDSGAWAKWMGAGQGAQGLMNLAGNNSEADRQARIAASNQAFKLGRGQLAQGAADAITKDQQYKSQLGANPMNIVQYMDYMKRTGSNVPLNDPTLTGYSPIVPDGALSPEQQKIRDFLTTDPGALAKGGAMKLTDGPAVVADASSGRILATLNENDTPGTGGKNEETLVPQKGGIHVKPGQKKTLGNYRQRKIINQAQQSMGTQPQGAPMPGMAGGGDMFNGGSALASMAQNEDLFSAFGQPGGVDAFMRAHPERWGGATPLAVGGWDNPGETVWNANMPDADGAAYLANRGYNAAGQRLPGELGNGQPVGPSEMASRSRPINARPMPVLKQRDANGAATNAPGTLAFEQQARAAGWTDAQIQATAGKLYGAAPTSSSPPTRIPTQPPVGGEGWRNPAPQPWSPPTRIPTQPPVGGEGWRNPAPQPRPIPEPQGLVSAPPQSNDQMPNQVGGEYEAFDPTDPYGIRSRKTAAFASGGMLPHFDDGGDLAGALRALSALPDHGASLQAQQQPDPWAAFRGRSASDIASFNAAYNPRPAQPAGGASTVPGVTTPIKDPNYGPSQGTDYGRLPAAGSGYSYIRDRDGNLTVVANPDSTFQNKYSHVEAGPDPGSGVGQYHTVQDALTPDMSQRLGQEYQGNDMKYRLSRASGDMSVVAPLLQAIQQQAGPTNRAGQTLPQQKLGGAPRQKLGNATGGGGGGGGTQPATPPAAPITDPNNTKAAAAKVLAAVGTNTLISPEFTAKLAAGQVPGLALISRRAYMSLTPEARGALTGLWISTGLARDQADIDEQLAKNSPAG